MNPLQDFFAGLYNVSADEYVMDHDYVTEFTGSKSARYSHKILPGGYMPNDLENTYDINKNGYRSSEFGLTKDVIVSGCSNTFGMGVSEDRVWGNLLCDSLGLTYDNIGIAGVSTAKIVANSMAHIKEYGKPKYLLCLFPNFARVSVPSTGQFYTSKERKHITPNKMELQKAKILAGIVEPYHSIPKMIKKPFYIEDIVNIETATMLAIQAIQQLSMYCKEAGIVFLWSTWANPEDAIFEWLSNEGMLDGYVDIHNSDWLYSFEQRTESYLKTPCHLELKSQYLSSFDIATDGEHLGVHRHAHIANDFAEALNNL